MKIYGIPNCATVKKARAWLDARRIAYDFVDFRKTPPTPGELARWCAALGWERVLNRRGATWRTLAPSLQRAVADEERAIALMCEKPVVIKRPVVESGATLLIGFDAAAWAERLR
jgi:Spx/MgsR family transcriptional regulator